MVSNDKKFVFSKETLMPLGMVISLCAGVVWISTELGSINHKLDSLEEKLEDQWTKRDMENWGLKLKMLNPDMDLPQFSGDN
jgi:hypothetical protein